MTIGFGNVELIGLTFQFGCNVEPTGAGGSLLGVGTIGHDTNDARANVTMTDCKLHWGWGCYTSGCIYFNGQTLTLNRVNITNNNANHGAALLLNTGQVLVKDSYINRNEAGRLLAAGRHVSNFSRRNESTRVVLSSELQHNGVSVMRSVSDV